MNFVPRVEAKTHLSFTRWTIWGIKIWSVPAESNEQKNEFHAMILVPLSPNLFEHLRNPTPVTDEGDYDQFMK